MNGSVRVPKGLERTGSSTGVARGRAAAASPRAWAAIRSRAVRWTCRARAASPSRRAASPRASRRSRGGRAGGVRLRHVGAGVEPGGAERRAHVLEPRLGGQVGGGDQAGLGLTQTGHGLRRRRREPGHRSRGELHRRAKVDQQMGQGMIVAQRRLGHGGRLVGRAGHARGGEGRRERRRVSGGGRPQTHQARRADQHGDGCGEGAGRPRPSRWTSAEVVAQVDNFIRGR